MSGSRNEDSHIQRHFGVRYACVNPASFLSINVTPDECSRALKHARERVSFLLWALEKHRDPAYTRTTLWRYTEAEYCRQVTQATAEMERLEQEADEYSGTRAPV